LFGLPKVGILFLSAKPFFKVFEGRFGFQISAPVVLIGVAKVRTFILAARGGRNLFSFSFCTLPGCKLSLTKLTSPEVPGFVKFCMPLFFQKTACSSC
jgi:hypothetical protein